jgi:hypothetical protein
MTKLSGFVRSRHEENPMSVHGYFTLMAAVMVAIQDQYGTVWKDGIVTGRTLEQDARYDIRFLDGTTERNVTADRIRPREAGRG